MAGVWANHLGLDTQLGAESDFFQLGGESLMAVRIVGQLSKLFQISIPLSVLLKTRTVAEMAEWDRQCSRKITGRKSGHDHRCPGRSKQKAPLSYAQQQMWLLDQLNPGQSILHNLSYYPVSQRPGSRHSRRDPDENPTASRNSAHHVCSYRW